MQDIVISAVEHGRSAILVSGNVKDYVVLDNRIVYRPWLIAELLQDQLHFLVIQYSRSAGLLLHNYSSLPPRTVQEIDSRLRAVGLESIFKQERRPNISEEIIQVFRGLTRLLMLAPTGSHRLAVLIDYTEHLASNHQGLGLDEELFVAESLHVMAVGPALKKSGNVLICFVREGRQNPLLNELYRVEYPFPGAEETSAFLEASISRYPETNGHQPSFIDASMSPTDFGRITRGIRIRDLDDMFRAARKDRVPVDRKQILAMKAQSVLSASEGTLSLAKSDVTLDDIVGLCVPKRILQTFSTRMQQGHPASPRCILFVGPPGTAKSTFACLLGEMAGFNVLVFDRIKDSFVGESERRLKLALRLIEDMQPAILVIDEITEQIPSRDIENADGGVSRNILAQLLEFSARESLRGKCVIVGTSNVPAKLDEAILDRFLIIPFLPPVPAEIIQLLYVFERRITGQITLPRDAPELTEAAQFLYQKNASPRKIYDIVNHAILTAEKQTLDPANLLRASKSFVGAENPYGIAYSALVALAITSFTDYYPWALEKDLRSYPLPWYLENIVDESGQLDRQKLGERIHQYKPLTNLS